MPEYTDKAIVDVASPNPVLRVKEKLYETMDHSIMLDDLSAEVLNMMVSGGSGATTIADGADVAEGAKADAAWDEIAGTASVISLLKKAVQRLTSIGVSNANILGGTTTIGTNTGTSATNSGTIATNTGAISTSTANTATSVATIATNSGTGNTSAATTATQTTTTATNTGNISTATGTQADTAWASGSGSVIAILKNLAAGIASTVSGVGAQADAAWSSGNGTLVSLLKNIAGTNSTTATNSTTLAGSVASARMNANIQRTGGTTTFTIASAATDSSAIDISTFITGGFIVPAAINATAFTYKVSHTTTGHQPLYDQYGNVVTTTNVTVNRAFPFPAEAMGFASLVVTSNGAESALRTFNLYRKG